MGSLYLLVTGAFLFLLFRTLSFFIPRWRSTLNQLRGPRAQSLLFGNIRQLDADYAPLHAKWFEEYGPTMRVCGIVTVSRRLGSDWNLS